jgi:hypothetical protein
MGFSFAKCLIFLREFGIFKSNLLLIYKNLKIKNFPYVSFKNIVDLSMITESRHTHLSKLVMVRQLLLFYKYLIAYSQGMAEYVKYNELTENRLSIAIGQLIGIVEEIVELAEAIWGLRGFREIGEEISDVWHSIVILVAMIVVPRCLWLKTGFWVVVAFLSLLYPIKKHGGRYLAHGCIRNHKHCLAKTHDCIVNSKGRV